MAEDNNISNIINNFKNMFQNNNTSNNPSEDTNIDITPEMINNFANLLQNSSNSSADNNNDNNDLNNSNNIDFETILKIKSIIETLNKKDDPRSKLLYSLKPYLRESKKKKLEQYVNLLKITQVTDLFKTGKGDEN